MNHHDNANIKAQEEDKYFIKHSLLRRSGCGIISIGEWVDPFLGNLATI